MPQIFSPGSDRRLTWAVALTVVAVLSAAALSLLYARSGEAWAVGRPSAQPIPFSHAVHAGGLGLDCRFCHAAVERSASAGMPTAETCMGCHAQVWTVTAQLVPLTTALAQGTPVAWSSVHRLPDHVRFDHAAHLRVGLGCETCHGAVREMPRTVRAETLSMGWCLDCHRRSSQPATAEGASQPGLAARVVAHEGIEVGALTRCSTCHR